MFERSKVPFEVKVLGIATCIQMFSVRRTARILSLASSGLYGPLFGTGYGSLKRDCLLVSEKKRRYLIALDERVVKAR
ncbi:hypothetical protein AIOGIFDO_00276 [Candidatus Methanoperedenaceae archaeon GB37]|nr:hypothetical protein AIOGIFDO_00276 [Candidatus Methanoperedenaceae archaeon GB37]